MELIRYGLSVGLDVTFYNKPDFNIKQIEIIIYGLKKNLDINLYANPKFPSAKMQEIRLKLEK